MRYDALAMWNRWNWDDLLPEYVFDKATLNPESDTMEEYVTEDYTSNERCLEKSRLYHQMLHYKHRLIIEVGRFCCTIQILVYGLHSMAWELIRHLSPWRVQLMDTRLRITICIYYR